MVTLPASTAIQLSAQRSEYQLADSLHVVAQGYLEADMWNDAIRILDSVAVLEDRQLPRRHDVQLVVWYQSGVALRHLDEYEAAFVRLRKAWGMAQELDLIYYEARILRELGVLEALRSEYDRAIFYLRLAIDRSVQILPDQIRASWLTLLADFLVASGQPAEAREYFLQAIEIYSRIRDIESVRKVEQRLALLGAR